MIMNALATGDLVSWLLKDMLVALCKKIHKDFFVVPSGGLVEILTGYRMHSLIIKIRQRAIYYRIEN